VTQLVVAALRNARARIEHPRRWVQGYWQAHRDDHGVLRRPQPLIGLQANCWCLGQALSLAVIEALGQQSFGVAHAELRSDCERELLTTLGTGPEPVNVPAIYIWQDAGNVSHADVLRCVDGTIQRLAPSDDVTRNPEWEARYDRARELARADVNNDRDPRVLQGELAEFQTEYDDQYTAAQLERVSN
jgi:hypothetical protein